MRPDLAFGAFFASCFALAFTSDAAADPKAAADAHAAAEEQSRRPPWVFVAGPGFGMEAGVRTTTGLGRMLFSYDDYLAANASLDESSAWGKALGIGGRFAKLIFIDGPLIELQAIVAHEVFGHGARGREAGLDPSYSFQLLPPYEWLLSGDNPGNASTSGARSGVLERDMAMTAGGIEADYFGAYWLNRDMMRSQGWMSYHDLLQYTGVKFSNVWRLGFTLSHPPTDPADHGDPDKYVSELQSRFNRWRPSDRIEIAESLRTAYLYNFIDPTFWQSVYHLVNTYLYEGKRDAKLAMIPLADDSYLYPSTRFNLSPFGAEHYLDLFVGYGGMVFDLYGRVGSSGLASYWGLGGRAAGIRPGFGLSLEGEVDVWTQPEMLFEERFVFERDNRAGISAGLHVDWHIYGRVIATGKLAAKSRGYLMGQPLDAGPYGYVGMSYAPGAKGAAFGPR